MTPGQTEFRPAVRKDHNRAAWFAALSGLLLLTNSAPDLAPPGDPVVGPFYNALGFDALGNNDSGFVLVAFDEQPTSTVMRSDWTEVPLPKTLATDYSTPTALIEEGM